MANNFNEFLRNSVLNHVFGGVTMTPPGSLYVGLSTTAIADNGTGATEPTGATYNRAAITNNKTFWTTATGAENAVSNSVEFSFPESDAAWGTISHFFLSDAPTGGNILVSGALEASKSIAAGDVARFPVDSLTIKLDDI
jgi:hypothetical protein